MNKERIIEGGRIFGEEQKEGNLVVKPLRLVIPENARELGVVIPEDEHSPVFISAEPEDHLWEDGRGIVEGQYFRYQVGGEIVPSNYVNSSGGGIFVRPPMWAWEDSYSPSRNNSEGGVWIAMVEASSLRSRGVVADRVKVRSIRAFCWFGSNRVEPHHKEIEEGFVVLDLDKRSLFPVCDLEEHPVWLQPRRLFGEEVLYRFSKSEDGNVQFS